MTGASTGIGAACAIEAAKHGAKLVISARSKDLLDDIKSKCIGNKIVFMNKSTEQAGNSHL